MKLKESCHLEFEPIPPFNFALSVCKPTYFPSPYETYANESYYLAFEISKNQPVGILLRSLGSISSPRVEATVFSNLALTKEEIGGLREKLDFRFGFSENISEFYNSIEQDEILALAIRDLFGMRLTCSISLFEIATITIILQNTTANMSQRMLQLLLRNFGEEVEFQGITLYTFISPQTIAKLEEEELKRSCRLGYRSRYLRSIAEKLSSNENKYDIDSLKLLSTQQLREILMDLKGIGEVSAEIILAEGFRRYEAFPVDSWIQRILTKLYFKSEDTISKKRILEFAEKRWGKYRALALTYILNDLENISKVFNVELKVLQW